MLIVFTDLDGTLLDHQSYSYEAALPALARIKELGVPLVLTTSKTRAEVEYWRRRLDNFDPFIVENGGALYMPTAYFPLTLTAPAFRNGYAVIEFGDSYQKLVDVLRKASAESQCRVAGFHDMSQEEVRSRTGLPMELATLAKQREYDEPFLILDPWCERLYERIEAHGKRWTQGGRFHHIIGANDKAHCVRLLTHFFQRAFGDTTTIGLGDGLNDARFLRAVDIPVVLKSDASAKLAARVPQARTSDCPGPEGWNRAVLEILAQYKDLKAKLTPAGFSPRISSHESYNRTT
jgi:mannosyl-3-phosphoglycerate phosphatase